MSRSGLRPRPRRRVYDCNYNAGQNLYKPTLEELDRKYYGKPSLSEGFVSPKLSSFFESDAKKSDIFSDEPLNAARRRAERVIQDDAFFDVRGARVPKSSVGEAIREFDEEFKSTMDRIRSNKKATNFSTDVDFEDAVDSMKRRNRFDIDSAFDENSGSKAASSATSKASSSIKKSSYKMSSHQEEDSEPIAITKWSAVEDSGAGLRARASKARLDDLESEMFERSEKQAAREKRSAQLKKFIADIADDMADDI